MSSNSCVSSRPSISRTMWVRELWVEPVKFGINGFFCAILYWAFENCPEFLQPLWIDLQHTRWQ